MANIHLVTGKGASNHIASADDGSLNAALIGSGFYILNRGNKAAITVVSNNSVSINTGDLLIQGRHIRITSPVTLSLDNNGAGTNRTDLIVVRYTKDSSTGNEEANLAVIKGTPSSGSASFPEYTSGNILDSNAILAEYPLYAVYFKGINLSTTKQLFISANATISNALSSNDIAEWAKAANKPSYTPQEIGAAASAHSHSGADITSGLVAVARGGTGLNVSPALLVNLESTSGASVFQASPRPGVTGVLPIARGGTGAGTGNAALQAFLAAGATVLSSHQYGTALPQAGTAGRIFFLKK